MGGQSKWLEERPLGFRLRLSLVLGITAAALIPLGTEGIFAQRLQLTNAAVSARLLAFGYSLLKDVGMPLIGFCVLRLSGHLFLPEIDLASQTLRNLRNGLLIMSSYIVGGHWPWHSSYGCVLDRVGVDGSL